MDKKSTIAVGLIILAGILGFTAVSVRRSELDTLREADVASTTRWENTPAESTGDVVVSPKTVVTAKHAFQNGKHIIAGEIPVPTPCHILESGATASADKMQVLVTLVSSIKTGEVCAQVITPARFKVTVDANKDAKILGLLNGQEVTMNLIEAGPNENLDNFELYIKG